MAVRESKAGEGEPIIEQTRKALRHGDNSIRVNISSVGRDIHGIEPGDELNVEIYADHIRLAPEE